MGALQFKHGIELNATANEIFISLFFKLFVMRTKCMLRWIGDSAKWQVQFNARVLINLKSFLAIRVNGL